MRLLKHLPTNDDEWRALVEFHRQHPQRQVDAKLDKQSKARRNTVERLAKKNKRKRKRRKR